MKAMRFLSLLLAAALMCALAIPALAEGEPVELTVGSAYMMPEDPSWLTYSTFEKLQSDLNIKIKYTYYDADKFSLMLASGDLPDIVIGRQAHLQEVLNNHMALNLDPYLDEYAPNMKLEQYTARNALLRETFGGENKELYFCPSNYGYELIDGGQDSPRGYNIRWDYYKEIGCPEINNDDDYFAALKAIAEKHPTTENGDKIYATGLYDSLNEWYIRASWTRASSLNQYTLSGYQYMGSWEDNELYDGYTDTERSCYWDDMRFYNKLYNADLLDPDSFTMTIDEQTEKTKKGQYLFRATMVKAELYNEMMKSDPDTLAGYVVIPCNANVYFSSMAHPMGNVPSYYTFISANTQNKEAALAFINYISDPDNIRMLYSGVQGETWDYDENGTPYIFDEMLEGKKTNSDAYVKAGLSKSLNLQSPLIPMSASEIHPDGHAFYLFYDKDYFTLGLTHLQEDYSAYYGVDYPAQAPMKFVNEGDAIGLDKCYSHVYAAAVPAIPNDIKRIMNQCNEIIYRAIPELVMARSDEEFAKIQERTLKDLANAGEQEAWEWYSAEYNIAKEKMSAILGK